MTNYHVIAKLAMDSSGRQKAQVNDIHVVSPSGFLNQFDFFHSFEAKGTKI